MCMQYVWQTAAKEEHNFFTFATKTIAIPHEKYYFANFLVKNILSRLCLYALAHHDNENSRVGRANKIKLFSLTFSLRSAGPCVFLLHSFARRSFLAVCILVLYVIRMVASDENISFEFLFCFSCSVCMFRFVLAGNAQQQIMNIINCATFTRKIWVFSKPLVVLHWILSNLRLSEPSVIPTDAIVSIRQAYDDFGGHTVILHIVCEHSTHFWL